MFHLNDPIFETLARFAINTVVMSILIFGMYYRRYRDKELATAASMFNIVAFSVLTILSSVQFSLAAGFGLFAILALFSLRSEQIGKVEISYFFGSIGVAVICSVSGTGLATVILICLFVLLGAWIIDHPKILQSSQSTKITLDSIKQQILSDPIGLKQELSEKLGVNVLNFQIIELNYVNDLARLHIFYKDKNGE
jgi:uncharacterized protein DUF4956